MKQYLFLLLVITSCREKIDIPVPKIEKKELPPKELGDFQINFSKGAALYLEPNVRSKVLVTAAVEEIVTVFDSLRTAMEPVRQSPVYLILTKYKGVTGWLDTDALIFSREAADRLYSFKGKVSDFKFGCLSDAPDDSESVACSNCGTLDFFPWGGFKGTLGCDEHLTGQWRLSGESIVIQAESEVMCNHAFNHPPTEAECTKFQASTRKNRTIMLMKNGGKWILKPELILTAEKAPYHLFSP